MVVDPKLTTVVKYQLALVNHSVAWEFLGLRFRHLGDLSYALCHRYKQLEAAYDEKVAAAGFNIAEAQVEMRLMDLLNLAINYVKRAEERIPIPHPPDGGALAVVLGPGIILTCEGLPCVEIPACISPPPSHN
jgi:hypothetical protein